MRLYKYSFFSTLMMLIANINQVSANHRSIHTSDDDQEEGHDHSRTLAILDPDNRVDYAPRRNGILFLQSPDWFGKNCTATLIHQEYAVTAKECTSTLPNWIAGARVHFNFQINLPQSFTGDIASVYQSEAYGFALIRVKPKADVGIMLTNEGSLSRVRQANMAGYMFHYSDGIHYCCRVIGIEPQDGRIKHECDGTDGAPLFVTTIKKQRINGKLRAVEKFVLLGVQNGVVSIDSTPIYNLAVPAKPIADLLKLVLQANIPDTSKPVFVWNENPVDPNICKMPNGNPTKAPVTKTSPTRLPVVSPTTSPSLSPEEGSSSSPTKRPTARPANPPAKRPTKKPTRKTSQPTKAPVNPTKAPANPTPPPAAPPTKAPANPTPPPAAPPTKAPANPTPPPAAPPTKAPVNPTPPPVAPPTKAPVNPTPPPVAPPTKAPANPTPPPSSKRPTPKPTNKPVCPRRLTGGHGSDSDCSDSDDDEPTKRPTPKPVTAPPSTRRPTRQPTNKPVCPRRLTGGHGSDSDCSDSDDDEPTKRPTPKPVTAPPSTRRPTRQPTKKPVCQRRLTSGYDSDDSDCSDDDNNHHGRRQLRPNKLKM